jgi:threonylcarbamoyladenosine tRNA methylthiotransferase CDKAL1
MSCGIVDDIEDILKNDSQLLNDDLSRSGNKPYVLPKSVIIKKSNELENNNSELNSFNNDTSSNIPGLATIWVKTWGCTHNTSDSEYMAGQLAAYGYKIVDEPNDANLWLLNSCTVKNPAEDHFKNYIDKAKAENKYLVLAGCVPQGAPKAQYIQGCSIIGVQQIDRIVEVVEQTLNGNSVRLFGKKKKDNKKYGGASLNLPKVRRNPLIESKFLI